MLTIPTSWTVAKGYPKMKLFVLACMCYLKAVAVLLQTDSNSHIMHRHNGVGSIQGAKVQVQASKPSGFGLRCIND